MTYAEQLAAFVVRASYDDLSAAARQQFKIHVLDSLGCAIGAIEGEPIQFLHQQIAEFDSTGRCSVIGGGCTAPDRAALYNSALVRYLDFNDSYLAKGETCHPSDNLGAVLAATEYVGGSGRDFLTALAVAYQVQCRLSDVAPVQSKGFDHTTQGSYAVAAGVSKALGLDQRRTAHAIALCGTAFNALRVTRTGALSHWEGLAYANTAFCCTHATFLAMRGVSGPLAVFEGNKGFIATITGPFILDWAREDLERVTHTILKKYNAEIYSQSVLEGVLELKHTHGFSTCDVATITIEIFAVAFHIIGGGGEGEKWCVRTKEEADHSLQYMVAVALLDDQVMPAQYRPERLQQSDVVTLLRKVVVRPVAAYSQRFPREMPCRITITLNTGQTWVTEKRDYEGSTTRPMRWDTVVQKFTDLSAPYTTAPLRARIIDAVAHLESIAVAELAQLLAQARIPGDSTRRSTSHDKEQRI